MNKTKEKNVFLVITSILIAVLCIMITPYTFQNDTYYTIKIGETISENGIDMKDHYSFHDNLDYTYPHWLFDLMTYKIYDSFGYYGVYIMTALLCVLLGLTIYFVNRKISGNALISFLITIFTMFFMSPYITGRAQILTFTLFVLELYFIYKFTEKKKTIYGILLFVISVIIANVHIAVWPFFFVLFLPPLAEEFVAYIMDRGKNTNLELKSYKKELIELKKENKDLEKISRYEEKILELENAQKEKIKRKEEKRKNPYKVTIERNKNVKWLVLIMAICFLSAFISPLGGKTTLSYLFKTMIGDTTNSISEHQPSTLIQNVPLLVFMIATIGILIFTRYKIRLRDALLLFGLMFLAIISRRQTSMLISLCSYILVSMVSSLMHTDNDRANEVAYDTVNHPLIVLYSVLFIIAIGSTLLFKNLPANFVDETEYPDKATNYILENIDYKNARIFNEYSVGSYLLLHDIPVFIDSRADLYSPEFNKDCTVFDDYMAVESGKEYYEDIFEKYNISHVLLKKNASLYTFISGEQNGRYNLIYSDENFALYERVSKNNVVAS